MIELVGVFVFKVKYLSDLDGFDGFVLFGGESIMMCKIMKCYDLMEFICVFVSEGKVIFGICVGFVFLLKEIEGGEESLGLIEVIVICNGFGR